jgi:hypothetical protein
MCNRGHSVPTFSFKFKYSTKFNIAALVGLRHRERGTQAAGTTTAAVYRKGGFTPEES